MKVKLYVGVIFVFAYNAIHAGPIQQRIEASLKVIEKRIQELAPLTNYSTWEYQKLSSSAKKKFDVQQDKLLKEAIQLSIRFGLLYKLVSCFEESKMSPAKSEATIANQCFKHMSTELSHEVKSNHELSEKINQELERIWKKDLRQSWFWWMW